MKLRLLVLDLLDERLLVAHLRHHLVGLLEGLDERVHSLVELVQILLHIFLLRLEVLGLLVREEGNMLGLEGGLIGALDDRFLVDHGLFLLLSHLFVVAGRVQVLLDHELVASLERSSLDVLGGLREQIAQVEQVVLGDTHEQDVESVLGRILVLLIVALGQGLEHDVGLEVVQDLVITEVAELGQEENGLRRAVLLVMLIVVDFDETLSDEEHFLDVLAEANDLAALRIDTAEQVDDEFVNEATLALIKEVVERLLEVLEDARILDQIRLHLGRDLMVEVELLDDQVEIVQEGLLDVLADVVVQ